MPAADSLKHILATSIPRYLPMASTFLLNDLQLPASMVVPPHELKCYIDHHLTHRFLIFAESVMPMALDHGSFDPSQPRESACYRPGADRLMLVSEMIDADASAAGLASMTLAEILVAHECVHAAMMGKVVANRPGALLDWVQRDDLRYIHESAALRFCEALPGLTGQHITRAEMERYLRFVDTRCATSPVGEAYARYFREFRDTPNASLWQVLTGNEPLVAELAG